MAGLGRNALRLIPLDSRFEMDVAQLKMAIQADLDSGYKPFLLVGTAGSVDVGAIDDLKQLADIAQAEKLWFHIDGAYGALAKLSPAIAPLAGWYRKGRFHRL